jgi:hypothetical protein
MEPSKPRKRGPLRAVRFSVGSLCTVNQGVKRGVPGPLAGGNVGADDRFCLKACDVMLDAVPCAVGSKADLRNAAGTMFPQMINDLLPDLLGPERTCAVGYGNFLHVTCVSVDQFRCLSKSE